MASTAYIDFFAGCLGGAAGVLAGHPLDTVKVRLQTQPQGARIYRGTFHCFSSIVRKEGAVGLYKGMSSPLASLAVNNAIVFGVHGYVLRCFDQPENRIGSHFVAGSAAGMAQAIIAAPTERLKLLMQIQTDAAHTVYKSPVDAAVRLAKTHGVTTLTRGFLATLVRDCPAFGIYFASYEYLARKMSKDGTMESLTNTQLLFAGGMSGMLSWVFNYPTDVVKTRFQANDSYTSYADCIRKTYAEGGVRMFLVGLGPTLIRAFPANAATFFTVEWTYRLLLDYDLLGVRNKAARSSCNYSLLECDIRHRFLSDLIYCLPEAGSTYVDPTIHHF